MVSGKSMMGTKPDRERERIREKGEQSERQSAAEKCCGISHKFDHWSSIYEGLEKG
jgi:hypothetical protein